MVQKIEASFNYVWYVDKPRSFARRFVEYVSVLVVGGLLILVALTMISVLQSAALVEYFVSNTFFGPAIAAAGKLLPYVIVCAVFTFLYIIVPNTHVRFTSALIGGIAGGIMWATVSVIFATFVVGSGAQQCGVCGLRGADLGADLGLSQLADPADRLADRLLHSEPRVSADRPARTALVETRCASASH